MKIPQSIEGELLNVDLLENLYDIYQKNPAEIDPAWVAYFQSIEANPYKKEFRKVDSPLAEMVIDKYRRTGHLKADINALLPAKESGVSFDEISKEEWEKQAPSYGLLPTETATLSELNEALRKIYCGTIGFEYKHVEEAHLSAWIQDQIENDFFKKELSPEQQQRILEYLNRSELFENFLHTKYVGQKRFSLEGVETLIPMLALVIETGAERGVQEYVLGMAHRGRLNVLSNILHKSYAEIFSEFEEISIPEALEGMGDVKYHKGYTGENLNTHFGGKIKITLSPNPSHLESVNSVVEGQTRAKQFLINDEIHRNKALPVLIHGDGAISGQGIVYETFQLSKLPGYATGGTIHIVINNQIGFTTLPRDLRSTHYCTDIARAFGCPIFHVNAEDPEGCVHAALLALEIRLRFHCDVVIDLNGYRKYGHNEGDEPAYTQPLEYRIIKGKKPIRELYRDQLLQREVLEKKIIEQLEEEFKKGMQEAHSEFRDKALIETPLKERMIHAEGSQSVPTGVDRAHLLVLAERFSRIPEGFRMHPKLENLVKDRVSRMAGNKPIDWGLAEHLAYASLLWEGIPIRLSGQDCCRGTFSHRHAVWVDQEKENEYFPLAHLKEAQGKFEAYNSPLSEMGVLGFEYGYSVAYLKGLTIWEAQFGDFGNGAQVIIDQYIASGEQKWGQRSGLVLYLPHGYEGQGPEHSSGRLERFLSLAGHDNMQIVNPTTPAQFFHVLRRQMHASLHRPLILFTPKGLLRHAACVSSLEELSGGSFQALIDDSGIKSPSSVRRLVFCSGRIYYDLVSERKQQNRSDVCFIRIEQLYPLDESLLKKIAGKYNESVEWMWVQEEPQNMGGWSFMFPKLMELVPPGIDLKYAGRARSATPATGSHLRHEQEHATLLKQVFSHEN
ncbi:MAG: 2-oxoglutarate dehydrogenase E1 component [Candidatus Protochlamydia sp.]|nr:2-oxoglutarate dehydrogenase E1 component [Candidatus Protochlamydia sp.]